MRKRFWNTPAAVVSRLILLQKLEDGRLLNVANVIWCTGFHPGFSWIDLPVLGEQEPLHERGVLPSQPGLYFVSPHFLYAASSGQIHGVGRDAEYGDCLFESWVLK